MADRFRCDYCGTMNALKSAKIWWTKADSIDTDQVYLPAVYCSDYCGRRASSAAGSGRG